MNTLKSIIRIAILIAIGLLGLVMLLSSIDNASELRAITHVVFELPFAGLLLYLFHRLYQRWSVTDKWIKTYNRWIQPEQS